MLSRWLLSLMACFALLHGAAAQPPGGADLRTAHDPALQRSLEAAVRDLGLDAPLAQRRLALALVDVTDTRAPPLAMLNGDQMMYAASMPKVGTLFGAMAKVESGRFVLDAERRRAMHNMIWQSRNIDATRVLKWVGENRLLEWLQSDRFGFYDGRGADRHARCWPIGGSFEPPTAALRAALVRYPVNVVGAAAGAP
jgi:beta-lactamase class A